MNCLHPEREAEAIRRFQNHQSIREIRQATGISTKSLRRIRRSITLPDCPCGGPAGHRGWCKWRFDRHPARHKIIGRLTKPVRFSQKRFNRWVKTLEENGMGDPADEHFNSGILLLAAFDLGTQNESKLRKATNLDPVFIASRAWNLRLNGVWLGGRKWGIPDDVNLDNHEQLTVWFALTSLVADGVVVCVNGSKYQSTKGQQRP